MAWPGPGERPFVLDRAFQRPTLDPSSETLLLALDDVIGVSRVLLNGGLIARPGGRQNSLLLALDGVLQRRNVLTLEVEPSAAGEAPGGQAAWGSVSLVVRPRAACGEPADALGESGEVP
jgi:hypothetical protein